VSTQIDVRQRLPHDLAWLVGPDLSVYQADYLWP
jgi:hypothetical protein